METPPAVSTTQPSPNRVLGLVLVVLVVGASVFMEFAPREGVAVGLLPRPEDDLVPLVWPVGNWEPGSKVAIGLKFWVKGEGLPPDQMVRFTEGSEKASGTVAILWKDEKDLPLGLPQELHFKDDC